jgi:hypothetical protein
VFHWTEKNDYFMLGALDSLIVGGGECVWGQRVASGVGVADAKMGMQWALWLVD